MWSCINGNLVTQVMMNEVKVVCGHQIFEFEVELEVVKKFKFNRQKLPRCINQNLHFFWPKFA